ncbi:beta-galactosidase GalA [Asticcacaulis tiandongensis]|uniref:beta-galactosidase GalA n=1 Tax=Asticcacaulis tiandongensis TaxID=2565365 RepID=UPI001127BA7E|nr:beta-galactosidase GalA [Asticcacaulis tiandongensis]
MNRRQLLLAGGASLALSASIAGAGWAAQSHAPLLATGFDDGIDPAIRSRQRLDKDWYFALGHATDADKDFGHGLRPFFFAKAGYGDGPASSEFSHAAWRQVNVPHDWAVELPFDARANTNHGSKAIGRNFPENSVGWYRKTFALTASDKGRRISLEFDGVYRNSVVWVNGHYMGTEPSGYSGFRYDITDYVNFDGQNLIAVRVDATVEEGWFYEGAGIYRHVWLTKTAPLHVAQWGTFVKSTVTATQADLDIDVTVDNSAETSETFILRHEAYGPDGRKVAEGEAHGLTVEAHSSGQFTAKLAIADAALWSLEAPNLYHLRTTLIKGGAVVDAYNTRFGIRTIVFDPEKGFFLNGKNLKLQGTNNHQDHAGVGVALPDGLQTWRLNQLKSFGVNAYRTAHHPPTPELLAAADQLGMLVVNEHRMMGTSPEIKGQLERLVRRDRNHPSVIIWSVGNEEWALENNPLGTHLAVEMQAYVKRLDPTRRTTVATSSSGRGVSLGADVIGFNYGAQHDVDAFHRAHPDKPAMMSEEGSTLTTRGIYFDDRSNSHLNAYDRQGRPGNSLSIEEGWRRVIERPWMSGMFIWTGFDYRGETTPFGWPAISSQFGMIDTTGVLKDTAYYLKSVWRPEPMVHILPHWNWAGREGEAMDVRVYSNAEAVELFLNGRSLGRKTIVAASHLKWEVPYVPGKLKARAYTGGKAVARAEVATTGSAAQIRLTPDKTALKADGDDIAVIWVNVTDKAGQIVPTASDMIQFDATGPIRILGMGNGNPGSHEADCPAERHTYHNVGSWRSLAVDTIEGRPEWVGGSVDTSDWRDPMKWLPPEQQPALTKGVVLQGRFDRPVTGPEDKIALYIDLLQPDQKVYVNGERVTAKSADGALWIELERGHLKAVNTLTYVLSTPEGGIPGMMDRSVGGTRWGVMRVTQPAAPWQRQAFNGWAQIIVQSTGTSGTATVKASGQTLKASVATFRVG